MYFRIQYFKHQLWPKPISVLINIVPNALVNYTSLEQHNSTSKELIISSWKVGRWWILNLISRNFIQSLFTYARPFYEYQWNSIEFQLSTWTWTFIANCTLQYILPIKAEGEDLLKWILHDPSKSRLPSKGSIETAPSGSVSTKNLLRASCMCKLKFNVKCNRREY